MRIADSPILAAGLAIITLVAGAPTASAHMLGTYFEVPGQEGFALEVSYDRRELKPEDPTFFLLALLHYEEKDSWNIPAYDDVEIVFSQSETLVFDTTLASDRAGQNTFVFAFPRSGYYDATITYRRDGAVLAAFAFPLVVSYWIGFSIEWWFLLGLSLAVVILAVFWAIQNIRTAKLFSRIAR